MEMEVVVGCFFWNMVFWAWWSGLQKIWIVCNYAIIVFNNTYKFVFFPQIPEDQEGVHRRGDDGRINWRGNRSHTFLDESLWNVKHACDLSKTTQYLTMAANPDDLRLQIVSRLSVGCKVCQSDSPTLSIIWSTGILVMMMMLVIHILTSLSPRFSQMKAQARITSRSPGNTILRTSLRSCDLGGQDGAVRNTSPRFQDMKTFLFWNNPLPTLLPVPCLQSVCDILRDLYTSSC